MITGRVVLGASSAVAPQNKSIRPNINVHTDTENQEEREYYQYNRNATSTSSQKLLAPHFSIGPRSNAWHDLAIDTKGRQAFAPVGIRWSCSRRPRSTLGVITFN